MKHSGATRIPKEMPARALWAGILLALLAGSAWSVWATTMPARHPGLVINEIVACGNGELRDEDGDFPDWLELHNAGSQAINLGRFALTDDLNKPAKWTFPDLTLPAGGYLVVYLSGKDRAGSSGQSPLLHTNFRLHQNGEFLGLYDILDSNFQPDVAFDGLHCIAGFSYGLQDNAGPYGYLEGPTPGRSNASSEVAGVGIVPPVSFSSVHGLYSSPFKLNLSVDSPNAIIRYTLDGSRPSSDAGQVYTQAIAIHGTTVVRAAAFKPDWLGSDVVSQSFIFVEDVLRQPDNPPGYPDSWGISRNNFENLAKGQPIPADYGMDATIVDNPAYRDALVQGLTDIPSLSLVMARQDFLDLYANTRERGRAWERPVSVEWIDPTADSSGFQINAGIRIHGNAARNENVRKHSFRLHFRTDYGAKLLEYPLFPDSTVTEFDTLVLRAGTDRSLAGRPEGWEYVASATFTEDEWMRRSQIDMSGVGSHGTFVHLYINGLYWGLYDVVERPDAAFAAAYLGGSGEEWLVVNDHGVVDGDPARVHNMMAFTLLDTPEERFAALAPTVDATAFDDYILLNWYAGTRDWPARNWYVVSRPPEDKTRFLSWDAENTWVAETGPFLGEDIPASVNWRSPIKAYFDTLMWNVDFRQQFADRVFRLILDDGPLSDANSLARWRRLNSAIDNAVVAETARWGDALADTPLTQAIWKQNCSRVEERIDGNASRLKTLLRSAGYYPAIDPPELSPGAERVTAGSTIAMTAISGTIYYSTDGTDPRLSGGTISPSAIAYDHPIVIQGNVHLMVRAKAGDQWSPLRTADLSVVPTRSQLVVSELMYNPVGGSSYEYVEVENVGSGTADLTGLHFDEGLQYSFPVSFPPLAPGERVVIARDRDAFSERYPGIPVIGVFRGKLANEGERLSLKDAQGQVAFTVGYDDESGWPISPDGRGDSLVYVNNQGNPDAPDNWAASAQENGSPGTGEPEGGGF